MGIPGQDRRLSSDGTSGTSLLLGEIPVFLGCPDVDPMHPQKLDIVAAVSSLYLNNLAS